MGSFSHHKKDGKKGNAHNQISMAVSSCSTCVLHAHTVWVNKDREILNLDCFCGKTCFKFSHSQECRGLCNEMTHAGENVFRGNTTVRGKTYDVSRSHPIYKKLRILYSLPPVESRKRWISPDPEDDSVVADDTVPDPEVGVVGDDPVVEDDGESCLS